MRLSKIDLSNLIAISHDDDYLGLVIDRGDSLDVIEIPAPVAAYEGLQQLDAIVASDVLALTETVDFNHLPGVKQTIDMHPIQSGMANAVGYDPDRNLLQIEFKSGSVYQYEDVDAATWRELQTSDSAGRFFNRRIKGQYRSCQVD
ncbi:KTSC domain-containing protein (plasmid) [Kovacikia minuta CCNUW1]|uniref:KTSC domain-containing protein n=1 Tax=Kovacikia minuta TaxID=2931930 RepID=UPI001CCF6B94|nr:KTSC domain-containing protein [Kovacikia minuta]UBF30329.1 KTSC domain-containing protein [Kovacikia minuta CCNUW1]